MKKNVSAVFFIAILLNSSIGWTGGRHGGGHFAGGHFGGYRGGYGSRGGGHHHGGWRVSPGFYGFGLGYGSGFYGGYPYYGRYGGFYGYPPTVVTVPVTPPVYIQQSPPIAQQYQAGYWYYCHKPEGYYPYVKECPNGWQQVEPRPPVSR